MKLLPFRRMKFLRRKDKRKDAQAAFEKGDLSSQHRQFGGSPQYQAQYSGPGLGHGGYSRAPSRASAWLLEQLPGPVLERIFAFVCPHTQDETYETQEQSSVEDACMLCDLRDLAHCVQVCRRWRKAAVRVL